MHKINSKLYNQIKLVNFLPLTVNNFLKKGEKEKTFVKVSKVLARIKKMNLLNNIFLVYRRIFINKIIFILKNNELISKNNLNSFLNTNELKFFKLKTYSRNDLDNLIITRNSLFLNNFYFKDFSQFFQYNEFLKIELAKKKKNLPSRHKTILLYKILLKKKMLKFFSNYLKIFSDKDSFKIHLNNDFLYYLRFENNKHHNFYLNKFFFFTDFHTILNRFSKFYSDVEHLLKFKSLNDLDYKNNFIKKKTFLFKKFMIFSFAYFLKGKKKLILKINFNLLNNVFFFKQKYFLKNMKKKVKIRKYYFLSKKIKLLRDEHKKLDKKYFNLKKFKKRMPRFEFKKRKFLYIKLMRAYRESRKQFFRFKKYKKFLKNKKFNTSFKNNLKKMKQNKLINNEDNNILNHFDFKYRIIKKPMKKKKNLRLNLFKYSLFPIFFSPAKFFNICLSYYRLYFTFKDQRVWGKQQKIPSLLNLQRDVRITARNFKKTLNETSINGVNFLENFCENILLAGAKKGFFFKLKKQAYIFMIKNAIFLQFLMRRRKGKSFKKRRRKKIDRK